MWPRRHAVRSLGFFLLLLPALAIDLAAAPAPRDESARPDLGAYVIIGWNDLGMHCSNKVFADLCVLPPFNTVWATMVRRGGPGISPAIVGPGYVVSYRFDANTYSVGKTDFWSHEDQLFGVQLPDNIGLTGRGLTGEMTWTLDHFDAVGIPLTPLDDADLVHEQPFQLARLDARNDLGVVVAATEIVAPVSNEMMCSSCHVPDPGETVDQSILRLHDEENGTQLMQSRPVLCAGCHASNALGAPGQPGVPNLSLAMHQKHAEYTHDCYHCHPGPNTQCLRDVMSQRYGIVCQDCHGTIYEVANTIEHGREPWLDEPRCGLCHGVNYSEEPNTLYRNSNNGHAGLYCPTCHSSPHAILPSREERDNRQNLALQGYAGTLDLCSVCHGSTPWGEGPHGLYPTGLRDPIPLGQASTAVSVSPNPMLSTAELRYRLTDVREVRLSIHDVTGREIRVLATRAVRAGDHTLVWDGRDEDGRPVSTGVYFCRLATGKETATARIIKL